MKKIIALLLACLMIVGLAACDKKEAQQTTNTESDEIPTQGSLPADHTPEDTTPEVTDITLKVWAPQEDLQADNNGWLPKLCKQYAEAYPLWNITWVFEACEAEDVAAKVAADPTAVADVFVYSHTQLEALLEAEILASLSGEVLSQMELDNSDEIINIFARKLTITDDADREEAIYGLPTDVDTWVMYYNSTVFTAEDVVSLDAMLAKGKVAFPLSDAEYLAAFYVANGGTFFGDGTNAALGIDFAGEKGIAVTKYLAQLMKNANFVVDAEGAGLTGLQDGSVAAVFGKAKDAKTIKAVLGDNMAVAVAPAITVNEQAKVLTPFRTIKAMGINANTENPKVASLLAAYLATPEAQLAHYEATAAVPVSTSLQEDTKVMGDKVIAAVLATAQKQTILLPGVTEMNSYWPAAAAFATSVINGEVVVEIADIKTAEFNTALNTPVVIVPDVVEPETTEPGTTEPETTDATVAATEDTTPATTEATVPATTAAQ